MNRRAVIFTDGACSYNGQDGARAGIGVFWESPYVPKNNICERISGRQTNQRAEIIAARTGIDQARNFGYRYVTVLLDSHYVKKAAEIWIPRWEQEGWYREVKNKREFIDLKNSMEGIQVDFEYVPSAENRADPLARQGASLESDDDDYY